MAFQAQVRMCNQFFVLYNFAVRNFCKFQANLKDFYIKLQSAFTLQVLLYSVLTGSSLLCMFDFPLTDRLSAKVFSSQVALFSADLCGTGCAHVCLCGLALL